MQESGTDTLDFTEEIGCKYGADGIQNFLKGEARKMAMELRMPLEEAEDCIDDPLEMEQSEMQK